MLGIREAGNDQCGIESPDRGAEEREAAFDIHAKSAQAHVYSPCTERKDT